MDMLGHIDISKDRFPCCIVWTPIPILTWLFPVIGHMGIALSSGIIRDFAGPYYVSEDQMAFGRPVKYWQMNPGLARNGVVGWDAGVTEASEIYKGRMHNLCCDNCHSHVATALCLMQYDGSGGWNMVKLAFLMLIHAFSCCHAETLNDKYVWEPHNTSDSIYLDTEPGYKIKVTINKFDFTDLEFAIIKPGNETDEIDGLVFAHNEATQKIYIIKNNEVFGQYFAANPSGFSVLFEKFGQIATTTEMSTSTDNGLPTPSENISTLLVVHVYGRPPSEFAGNDVLGKFKKAVVGMASEYCTTEQFHLNETISDKNILIDTLVGCPFNWPNSDKCVEILFGVPVIINEELETKWTGYQLTTLHLQIMWDRYADKYLSDGMSIYEEPDVDQVVIYWAITISLIVLTFIGLLIVIRTCPPYCLNGRLRKRKSSDAGSILNRSSAGSRQWEDPLQPHYLTEPPLFFESDMSFQPVQNKGPLPLDYQDDIMEPEGVLTNIDEGESGA